MTRPSYNGWSTSSLYRLLLNPDPGGTAGGGTLPTPEPVPAPAPTPSADPTEGFKAALKKHGDDATGLAREAFLNSEIYRRERDEARGKIPASGSVVLSKEDADTWEKFRALGSFDEVKGKLDAGDLAATTVKTHERQTLIGKAAEAHGFDAEVLTRLLGDEARIELKDAVVKGKPGKVAEVVTVATGADGKEVETRTALEKHANTEWAKFLPALKAGASVPSPQNGPMRRIAGRPPVTVTSGAVASPASSSEPRRLLTRF